VSRSRGAFEELITEAVAAPFSGWDFSWLDARSSTTDLPWTYRAEVARYSGTARAWSTWVLAAAKSWPRSWLA